MRRSRPRAISESAGPADRGSSGAEPEEGHACQQSPEESSPGNPRQPFVHQFHGRNPRAGVPMPLVSHPEPGVYKTKVGDAEECEPGGRYAGRPAWIWSLGIAIAFSLSPRSTQTKHPLNTFSYPILSSRLVMNMSRGG